MATVDIKSNRTGKFWEGLLKFWENLRNNDEGRPLNCHDWDNAVIQVTGIFHRAVVHIQGSLDGETWADLKYDNGEPMIISDHSLVTINQKVCYLRPIATGGDSLTTLNVYILGSLK